MAVFRSELFKLRTTRTVLTLVLALIGLIVLVVIASGFAVSIAQLSERKDQFMLLANGSIASAFAAVIGILTVTGEFRHGTIRPTLLATPKRWQVVLAKVVASALAGALLGAFGAALSFGLGRFVMHARGIPAVLSSRDITLIFVGSIVVSALWGALGAGLGATLRNQVGTLVGMFVWALVLEGILFAVVPGFGRFLPGEAGNALVQVETPHRLSVLLGALVLMGYALVATAAGVTVTERRDVT